MVKSANGKGRTLWEIITGQNIKDMTPVEHLYHNPIKAKIGVSVEFTHDLKLSGINFFVERIDVYETKINKKKYYHTDYALRGIKLGETKPIRLRLRVTPNEDADSGYDYQLLFLYHEMGWDQEFHDNVLGDATGEFHVNHDDDGNELSEPIKYWRIDDATDPYKARLTSMKDANKDGEVDDSELDHSDVTYWDYSRMTDDEAGHEFCEFLFIEMDNESRYFTFLRGTNILPSQVQVI